MTDLPKDDDVGETSSNTPEVIPVDENIDDQEVTEEGGNGMNTNTFNREPAFWIGLAASVILFIARQLVGGGVITEEVESSVTNFVGVLFPLIVGLLTRNFVTPVAAPSLPLGTPVLVKGTGDEPPADAEVRPVR